MFFSYALVWILKRGLIVRNGKIGDCFKYKQIDLHMINFCVLFQLLDETRNQAMRPRPLEKEDKLQTTEKRFYFESIAEINDPKNLDSKTVENLIKGISAHHSDFDSWASLKGKLLGTTLSYKYYILEVIDAEIDPDKWSRAEIRGNKCGKIKAESVFKVYPGWANVSENPKAYAKAHKNGIKNPAFLSTAQKEKAQREAFEASLVENNVTKYDMYTPELITLVYSFFQKTVIIKDSLVTNSVDDLVQKTAPTVTKK
jgi:hypothetical protein